MKPGYKLTEVGVIPEDWQLTELPQVIWYQEGPGLRKWQFTQKGLKVINVTNLQDTGFLDLDKTDRYISKEEFERTYKHFLIDENDFVMASSGNSYCKTSLVRKCDLPLLMNTSVIRFKALPGITSGFMQIYLKSKYLKEQIDLLITGGAQPNFGPAHLKKVFIPLPPNTEEQTAIANTLGDADALIQSLIRLITKKRQIKQGAMQTLLNPYENGRLKEGWVVKKLGESCEMYSGGTPNTSVTAYYGGDIQWITSGDLNKGIITEVKGRITKMGLTNSSAKTITRDTLLIALYGATSGVVAISKINAAINQAVLAIIPDESLKSVFLFYMLTYLKDWIIATYTQGGQPNLSGNILKSIEFYCPDVDEQARIATTLSDMDTEIATLEAKLAKYRHIKQGMMQNLLTGRIRLAQPGSNAGAVA